MSSFVLDIETLYQRTFGSKPYRVPGMEPSNDPGSPYVVNGSNTTISQITGSALVDQYLGIEIWLPLYLRDLPATLFPQTTWFLPFSVVRVTGSSSYVKTPLIERRGSVKELYSVNDYQITVKGFFIDIQNRVFPDSVDTPRKLSQIYRDSEPNISRETMPVSR
jgi:hypothetical protein